MKKADIHEDCDSSGSQDCKNCPEYDTCDYCGRRVGYYAAVFVDDEVWCRHCARSAGASEEDIKEQRFQIA